MRWLDLNEAELENLIFGNDVVESITKRSLAPATTVATTSKVQEIPVVDVPAWRDEDDELLQVDLNRTDRLKKLKSSHAADSNQVSGADLSGLLAKR